MNELFVLTDKALDELKNSINVKNYQEENFDLSNRFKERYYKSSINIKLELPLLKFDRSGNSFWEQDFENSKTLHRTIRSENIPLRYLVDERFWTYLTHTYYFEYLVDRWPPETEKRIEEKWFFKGGNQVFSRHSLVRLWWLAECSYDENRDDPYELTKIAFEYQDPFNQVLERKISKSRRVFKSVLIAFLESENSEKLKSNQNRSKFGKALNNIAGVKLLDVLPEDELVDIFKEQIKIITCS